MNEGRSARLVTWPDFGNERGRCIRANEPGRIIFTASPPIVWLLEFDEQGNETARHNAAYVESIVWF